MAIRYYRANVAVACWKQHCCVNCGALFRYRLRRSLMATGMTPADAQANLAGQMVLALRDEVDPQPCPCCGVYQPEMMGRPRADRQRKLAWIYLTVLVGTFLLYCLDALQIREAALYSGCLCGAFAAVSFLTSWFDPNANLPRNRERAANEMLRGVAILDRAPEGPRPDTVPPAAKLGRAHRVGVALVLVSVLGPFSCELVRTARGWAHNDGWHPGVIGPGDHARICFQDNIHSIKGYWDGRASAIVTNGAELGLAKEVLTASTQRGSWGKTISSKRSEAGKSTSLWMGLTAPQVSQPEGKTMILDLTLVVKYPKAALFTNFEVTSETLRMTKSVTLASPGAGDTYLALWWVGGLAGMGLAVAGCAWLSTLGARLQERASTTQIIMDAAPGSGRK